MATFTERLELLITASSKGAVSELNRTSDATDDLTKKQGLLGRSLDSVGNSMQIANGGLVKAGVAAGAMAAATVKFAVDSANAYADLGTEVLDFQRVSGASADTSSRMVATLDDLGISAETGSKGMFKLSKEIAGGNVALDAYGVDVATAADGSADLVGTLLNVADAYTHAKDPVDQNAIATAAFGKAGKDLIPILEQGRAGLKAMFADVPRGQLFTQDKLDNAFAYKLALDNLNDSLSDVALQVGGALAPAMTVAANTTGDALTGVDQLLDPIGGLGGAVSATATGFFDFATSLGGMIPGTGLLRQGVSELADVFGIGGDNAETFATKQNKLKEAMTRVFDLQAAGKEGTKEYADAVRDAKAAGDELTTTNQAVAKSFDDQAVAEYNAHQQHLALIDAGLALQSSVLNVKGALDDETKAQKDAQDAAAFGVDQSADVQQAHIGTEQAIRKVIDAATAYALDALPKTANEQEKATAATDAQSDALAWLAATTPNSTQAIKDLGYEIRVLPNGKTVVITADVSQAIDAVSTLAQKIADVARDAAQSAVGAISVGGSKSRAAPASAGLSMPGAVGLSAAAVPELVAAPAARMGAAPITHVTINVAAGGLGADAPEIQRAVVAALRGYVDRNGPIRDVVGA